VRWVQLELSVELGSGFLLCVFFFSSDSRACVQGAELKTESLCGLA
jgi:hypothetical protein